MEEAKEIAAQIDTILKQGGFKVKKWSFVENERVNTGAPTIQLGGASESVLGMNYDLETDEFFFKISLNFGKKKRGAKTEPNLNRNEIFDKKMVPKLTKRNIMAQTHTIYDPLGKLQPILVEVKFALGKLYRYRKEDNVQGWDETVPEKYDQQWRHLLNQFFDIENIRFPRCLSARNVVGDPMLIIFSDSSMIAFGACLYLRWKLDNGQHFVRLVTAKSRMWPIDPLDYLSVCRGELQGAVLAKRLASSFLQATRFNIKETIFVMDSDIVLAQMNMDSHNFTIFVGHRIAEIISVFPPNMWWFTRSENNTCADLLSRGTQNLSDLDVTSDWQKGPDWLYTERETWPISQKITSKEPVPELRIHDVRRRTMLAQVNQDLCTDTSKVNGDVPARIAFMIQNLGENRDDITIDMIPISFTFTEKQQDNIAKMIDLSRHDDWNFWLGVTFRVLIALTWKTGDGCFFARFLDPPVVSAEQRKIAEQFWLKQAQKPLEEDLKSGKYKTLTPFKDPDGIYRCNARAMKTPGGYHPVLLPHSHPVSRLLVIMYHRRGHHGFTGTASKTRAEYHILQVRHLATKIRNSCHLCRLIEKRLMRAPMGSLPYYRLHASYSFEHSSCDICGPFHVLLEGKWTRQRKMDPGYAKAYFLVITCLSTRAVAVVAMQGQNTTELLLALRRFIAVRGQPKSMYSDCGGQLMAADEELKTMTDSWNNNQILEFSAANGMQWTYSSPGSPWQNGLSESLVKSVKKTLKTILHPSTKLRILEYETIFAEVAELLNERPIGLGHQGASGSDFDADSNTYLCPNELLLGRCSTAVPSVPSSSAHVSTGERLLANQTLVTKFWQKWHELYVPTLMKQSKWFKYDRTPKVGDIVHIKDLNPIRGNWNIGEVVEVPSTDNVSPINVLIRYKRPGGSRLSYSSSPDKFQWRDVKNLVLIVDVSERSKLNKNAVEFRAKSAT